MGYLTMKRVSREQVGVMRVFMDSPSAWFDSFTVRDKSSLPLASVRILLITFFKMGLLERQEVHPQFLYRLHPEAAASEYFPRLIAGAQAMGLELVSA